MGSRFFLKVCLHAGFTSCICHHGVRSTLLSKKGRNFACVNFAALAEHPDARRHLTWCSNAADRGRPFPVDANMSFTALQGNERESERDEEEEREERERDEENKREIRQREREKETRNKTEREREKKQPVSQTKFHQKPSYFTLSILQHLRHGLCKTMGSERNRHIKKKPKKKQVTDKKT